MIKPRQSLGQNFLQDPNTARKIVAALAAPSEAPVVEIGPGLGALTGWLLAQYPDLIALEIDQRAIAQLQETWPALDVRHVNVLDVDWVKLAEVHKAQLYVIGNLPYNLTSQILFALISASAYLRRAVLMMQAEVAERIVAEAGSKTYGILSVLTQIYARPTLCFRVSNRVFYPKPAVTSAVLSLDFRDQNLLDGVDPEQVRQVVRMAFNQRRKTLRNSLKPLLQKHPESLPEPWASLRPEALPPTEFVALARWLTQD